MTRDGPAVLNRPRHEPLTPAELRQAMRNSSMSLRRCLLLGISQAVLATAFIIIMALQKANGVSVFADAAALTFGFAAVVSLVAAIALIVAAIGKARQRPDGGLQNGGVPNKSFLASVLPISSLVVSIGVIDLAGTYAYQDHERNQRSALIQSRLDSLKVRMDGSG
jgi:hypothetical protein